MKQPTGITFAAPFSLTAAALVLAGVFAFLGVSFDFSITPIIRPKATTRAALNPESGVWDKAPFADLATLQPDGAARFVRMKALHDPTHVYIYVEWPDKSKDMSYEGANYRDAIEMGQILAQESVLLRDELEIRFARSSQGSPLSALADSRWYGSWVWKSQWQADFDAQALPKVREAYPREYVDTYPFPDDVVYVPAWALENSAAISNVYEPVQWVAPRIRGGFAQPERTDLAGNGVWRKDKWKVVVAVPRSSVVPGRSLPKGSLDMVFAITDGGHGERKGRLGLSEPVRLIVEDYAEDARR